MYADVGGWLRRVVCLYEIVAKKPGVCIKSLVLNRKKFILRAWSLTEKGDSKECLVVYINSRSWGVLPKSV